jgi:hypothetical protein
MLFFGICLCCQGSCFWWPSSIFQFYWCNA